MIAFENVSKFILQNVSIYVPRGEIVGLLGPSGAGKTTFLKLASGLLEAKQGYVRIMGKKPNRDDSLKRKRVAFFAETPFLCRRDTVEECFYELKSIYHVPATEFQDRYRELEEKLDFGKTRKERLHSLWKMCQKG